MTSAATRLATLASCGAALLVLMLYVPALDAPFLVPKFAALELLASLGFLAFALSRAEPSAVSWSRAIRRGALAVLGTSSLAWVGALRHAPGAPYALDALARWAALFGIASGTMVISQARPRVLQAVTVAAAVVASVGLLQHFELVHLSLPVFSTPGSTFGNRNMAAEVMAMALPCGLGALACARSDARAMTLAAMALELVFLAVTRTRGAWLGATLGLGTALILARRQWPRTSVAAGATAVVVAVFATALPGRPNPHDAGDSKRYSRIADVLHDSFDPHGAALRTRIGLWRRTLEMIRDNPLLGVGPGNWPVTFPRYAEPGAMEDGVLTATVVPREAHNDLLQLTAETGLFGLLAFGLLVVGTATAIRQRLRTEGEEERAMTAAAAGSLVALLAAGSTSFPLEMPGTLALGGLALGLVAANVDGHETRPKVSRIPIRVWVLVGSATFLVAGWRAQRSIRVSRWLGAADRSNGSKGDRGKALEQLRRALSVSPGDFRAELRVARVLLDESRPEESAEAARRALTTEPSSPNAWAALAGAELAMGAPDSARADATHALSLLRDYPFALGVRFAAGEQIGDSVSAQADRSHLQALANGCPDRETSEAATRIFTYGPPHLK